MSILIENIAAPSGEQWKAAIRGMRNPMNSWEKTDSADFTDPLTGEREFVLGQADLELMRKLAKAGSDHRKYLRQLPVIMDVTAPLYWWKEADQYKVGTVTDSCSTMHRIQAKAFVRDDFSWEHLFNWMHEEDGDDTSYCTVKHHGPDESVLERKKYPLDILDETIWALNFYRNKYLETWDKRFWWQMIQMLPSSYNQKRTLSLNYEVLWNMYQARHAHKLDEWVRFCETIVREIPFFAEIFEIK